MKKFTAVYLTNTGREIRIVIEACSDDMNDENIAQVLHPHLTLLYLL